MTVSVIGVGRKDAKVAKRTFASGITGSSYRRGMVASGAG